MAEKKRFIQSKHSKSQSRGSEIPFLKTEVWLSGISGTLMYWIIGLGILSALLLFNARILETDDGLYIEGGYHYAKDFLGYYFTASAALSYRKLLFPK